MNYDFTSHEARKQRLEEGWFCKWKDGNEKGFPIGFYPLKPPDTEGYRGPGSLYISKYTPNPWFDRFTTSDQVTEFIKEQAATGSVYHQAALALLVRKEFEK